MAIKVTNEENSLSEVYIEVYTENRIDVGRLGLSLSFHTQPAAGSVK